MAERKRTLKPYSRQRRAGSVAAQKLSSLMMVQPGICDKVGLGADLKLAHSPQVSSTWFAIEVHKLTDSFLYRL